MSSYPKIIPPYEGYIFDLDGTLIDSSGDIAGAVNRARETKGLKTLPKNEVLPMIGNGLPKLVERAFADSDLTFNDDLIDHVRTCYLGDPCSRTEIYPGAIETLEALSSKKLGIISNKPSELMKPTLEGLALLHHFDITIGGEDFPEKKPNPAAAFHLLKKWNLPAEKVLMIGDMKPDRDLAKNAGLPFAHCRFGFLEEELDCQHPIHDLRELIP